jgi:hypothetical protein
MTMIDEKFALLRTHRNNISRYRRLLKTELTEFERQFIERRLSEERCAMEHLLPLPRSLSPSQFRRRSWKESPLKP